MANPTTNYGFVLPTASDLVTDLPADFDVALQGVDTRLKALQPGTTLGDLAYSSATANTNTRLGIGSTGQVLTVAGGVPSWATPAGGSAKSYTLLNAGGTTFSGATTTISSIGGYDTYWIFYANEAVGAFTNSLQFRLNSDSSSKYNNVGPDITYMTAGAVSGQDPNTTTSANLSRAVSNQTNSGFLEIDGCNSSGVKKWWGIGAGEGTGSRARMMGGVYTGTSVITSISFFEGFSNSFTGGTVYVYGAN